MAALPPVPADPGAIEEQPAADREPRILTRDQLMTYIFIGITNLITVVLILAWILLAITHQNPNHNAFAISTSVFGTLYYMAAYFELGYTWTDIVSSEGLDEFLQNIKEAGPTATMRANGYMTVYAPYQDANGNVIHNYETHSVFSAAEGLEFAQYVDIPARPFNLQEISRGSRYIKLHARVLFGSVDDETANYITVQEARFHAAHIARAPTVHIYTDYQLHGDPNTKIVLDMSPDDDRPLAMIITANVLLILLLFGYPMMVWRHNLATEHTIYPRKLFSRTDVDPAIVPQLVHNNQI